ncbi:MAG: tetratricopeptide repeat protein [bacterium]|nr:tetratricopeptide repeat protein [bacterium]
MKKIFCIFLFLAGGLAAEVKETDLLFQEALFYYQSQRLDKALETFSKLLEKDPSYPKAQELFVETLKKRAGKEGVRSQESRVKSQESGVKSQESERRSQKEGVGRKEPKEIKIAPKLEEPEKATWTEELIIPEIEKKEEEKPKPVLPKKGQDYLFAYTLIKKGFYQPAINELGQILTEEPETKIKDKILFTMAQILFKMEKYAEAISVLKTLLTETPKSSLVYEANLSIADSLFSQKNFLDARLQYLKVLHKLSNEDILEDPYPELPPTLRKKEELLAETQLGIGNTYKRLGEYQKSIVEYQKVLDLYPKTASADDACFYLADIYDREPLIRDFEKAVRIYKLLMEAYPDSIWFDRAKERKKYLEKNYL